MSGTPSCQWWYSDQHRVGRCMATGVSTTSPICWQLKEDGQCPVAHGLVSK